MKELQQACWAVVDYDRVVCRHLNYQAAFALAQQCARESMSVIVTTDEAAARFNAQGGAR